MIRIERGSTLRLQHPHGQVRARFAIVVAGNAYLGNLLPELAAKSMPCGSQVIATEPARTKSQRPRPLAGRSTASRIATTCSTISACPPTAA